MRKLWVGLSMLTISSGSALAAIDLVPTGLTVVLVDSSSDPELDSVKISMEFTIKGGTTKALGEMWVINEISLDGILRLNGVVDSNQTLSAGAGYANTIGAWVEKKPFSAAGYMDPAGVSGEAISAAQNNLIIRKFNFHPNQVRKDTVYTGKNCGPIAEGGK